MSSRSKGAKAERECRNNLEELGYMTFSPQKTSFFGTQDIFNMFDIVAIKSNELRFIQVKHSTGGFLKKLKLWATEHKIENVLWELWIRKDKRKTGKTWRKCLWNVGYYWEEKG